jgi:hypothetical protein
MPGLVERLQIAARTRHLPADLAADLDSALEKYQQGLCSLDSALAGRNLEQRDELLRQAAARLSPGLSRRAKAMDLLHRARRLDRQRSAPDTPIEQLVSKALLCGPMPGDRQLQRILGDL